MSDHLKLLAQLTTQAKFREGESVDVPKYLKDHGNPEAAEAWVDMNLEHRDNFKAAFGGILAEGCPDNLDKSECAEWEANTDKYRDVVKDQHKSADYLGQLADLSNGVMAEGCPDNLDPSECKEWETNTEKYKDVVKDQHKTALMSEVDQRKLLIQWNRKGYDEKDRMRMDDLIAKANGVLAKEEALAERMAQAITGAAKAYRRALAAEDYNYHSVARIFYNRAYQLMDMGKLASAEDEEENERIASLQSMIDINLKDGEDNFAPASAVPGDPRVKGPKQTPKPQIGPKVASDKQADMGDDPVERVKKPGQWNIMLRKSRATRWDYFVENPQGGGGGTTSFTSAKAALQTAVARTNFRGADKAWVIQATWDAAQANYKVIKTGWLPLEAQADPKELSEAELWDMMTRAAAGEDEKEGMFEKDKPADPTVNMSPEDAAEWKRQTEEHKDQFKSAAAAGLYGFTRGIQSDCEACVRKLSRHAEKVARSAYKKSEDVAPFLSTHAKRADSLPAKILLAAMKNLGPKIAADEEPEEPKSEEPESKEAARKYSLYGYPAKTASLGLNACNEIRDMAGQLTVDLHGRRADKHAHVTGFFASHTKEAKCLYSKLLHASYPEADRRVASTTPKTVADWLGWEE